jgi:hypothetical protein
VPKVIPYDPIYEIGIPNDWIAETAFAGFQTRRPAYLFASKFYAGPLIPQVRDFLLRRIPP